MSVKETKVICNRSLPSCQDDFLLSCYHLPLCTHSVQATEALFLSSDSLSLFFCKNFFALAGFKCNPWLCRGHLIPISFHNRLFSIQVSTVSTLAQVNSSSLLPIILSHHPIFFYWEYLKLSCTLICFAFFLLTLEPNLHESNCLPWFNIIWI